MSLTYTGPGTMSRIEALTVDTEEAARLIGLAVSTLEKLRVYGDGPRFVKLGRSVRYRVCDLEDYLANRVVYSTAQRLPHEEPRLRQ